MLQKRQGPIAGLSGVMQRRLRNRHRLDPVRQRLGSAAAADVLHRFQAMPGYIGQYRLHVFGQHGIAPGDKGPGARGGEQAEAGARAQTRCELRRLARGLDQRRNSQRV